MPINSKLASAAHQEESEATPTPEELVEMRQYTETRLQSAARQVREAFRSLNKIDSPTIEGPELSEGPPLRAYRTPNILQEAVRTADNLVRFVGVQIPNTIARTVRETSKTLLEPIDMIVLDRDRKRRSA